MPNVYDARINRSTVGEIVYKHNRLVDLLGKDLSAVVQGGGVGDVRSPTVPGATDGNVPLWDGTSGKLLKNSNIDGDWFNQDVKTTAGVEFSSVSTRQVYAWAPTDSDYALSLASPTEQAGVWVEVSDAASTLDMWVFDENDGGPNVKALSANLVTGETTLHALDVSTTLTINGTPVLTSAMIDDTAYGASWDGDTTHAPTKNAIYDKIEGMGGASVSDEAYGSSWNGVTTVAPSKNAVYDEIQGHDDVEVILDKVINGGDGEIAGQLNAILNGGAMPALAHPHALVEEVLTFTNTTAFTPDSDYEPATKKYVDDLIGTPLAGTKVYYVADSSGGAVTRKLTFTNGLLTSET